MVQIQPFTEEPGLDTTAAASAVPGLLHQAVQANR